ncbi:hypothetical protein GCM10011611_67670 [Aliidongia dinghuensis]|uniref:Lipoprotein n=1 Tax=Aliidongia dinghuensis TaxID=1867774 RepID=A0A8J3E777_9PROT|nr:hypothetical protein [Aliidongia dinghuensis]GGF51650.1 hypothetical protein GCM10011611_67670 [Aliidongia dinghuensis]
MKRKFVYISFLLPLAILMGCTSTVIKSARSTNYDKVEKSLFIAASLMDDSFGITGGERKKAFAALFRNDLQACGIDSRVEFVENTALHLEIDKKIKEFEPNAALYVQWEHVGLSGRIFHADLIDQKSNVNVWNSNIDIAEGLELDTASALVKSLINQMTADKVLPAGCALSTA